MTSLKTPKKIAVIGSGITGLSCAWLLDLNGHDVTVFEKDNRIGGHANTYTLPDGQKVDTGFIVYNEWTYPNLISFFKLLSVNVTKTDMSFGVSMNDGRFEYGSDHIFAQKKNLLSLSFYRMLIDLVRFYKTAPAYLKSDDELTLGQYLEKHSYSKIFTDNHILPMAASIWSMTSEEASQFPMKSFLRFFQNHGLLRLLKRPQWWTVKDGSQHYVSTLKNALTCDIKINHHIEKIERSEDGIRIDGESFDDVVFACHPDQTLSLLNDPTDNETEILSAFTYSKNTAVLHDDKTLMPQRKAAWSAWNYMGGRKDDSLCVTYWMNRLQNYLTSERNVFVTLNPNKNIDKDKVIASFEYEHPQYTEKTLASWKHISKLQGKRNSWFCGAWCGYGFHEDGISAGLAVAEKLGECKRPWSVKDISPAGHHAVG